MDNLTGEVELFAVDYAPDGWVACEGQYLSVIQFPELFGVLGTKFGGDGRVTFGLPDLRKAIPTNGMHYYIAVVGITPVVK
ncbi:MAG TPA: phage tail protein [Firmicutes bacterium]|jgi:microcystin-dependent protein|nr:phage tail protein [Bacillota bacterium]